MSHHECDQKQTRTQRRVLRTRATIEQAFIDLVLEKGYDKVSVEDITNKADVARATFYAHYTNKEALLSAVFSHLIEGLGDLLSSRDLPSGGDPHSGDARWSGIVTACRHAGEMRDLYKACLSDSWSREAYLGLITRFVEQDFADALVAAGSKPRIPVAVVSRGFAGAHVAILESWLAGDIAGGAEEIATMETDLLTGGSALALGIDPEELGYPAGPGTEVAESEIKGPRPSG